ncbi:MAG: thioredoxin domain-containing protein [Anaerolineaceae bacterium]
MTNHLSNETSPYLLQHAENPVDWYPWGDEALNKAKKEDKPIFLSIGYSSCHWCHVMAHESFEDPDVAKVINQFFVPIKVDREERPDIDTLYMSSVVAMTGQGGWPMSVFLKPTGEPFFAGTYFPPERRYGMPGFKEVLFNIRHIWQINRKEIDEVTGNTLLHLQMVNRFENKDGIIFTAEKLQAAVTEVLNGYSSVDQGWGPAPLFPHPITLEFLLQQFARRQSTEVLAAVTENLHAMASGGMWDVVGGGFHRYSTDNHWHIPHFEKMLYDNAQLARVYLHAYQVTGDESFRAVVERTLDFIQRELSSPAGGFFSSLDADSEGEEGAYYTWSAEELQEALASQSEWELLQTVFNLEPSEKIDGKIVLQRKIGDIEAARLNNLPLEEFLSQLNIILRKLLLARFMRIRPGTDDKILVSWNSLTGLAFSEAGRCLNRPEYLQAAQRSAAFLKSNLLKGGRLFRSHRSGQNSPQAGFLEDYAASILFLVDLYQSDHNQEWFDLALDFCKEMIDLFADETGGFFDTLAGDTSLIVRPKTVQDNATPSGSALAARALLSMSELDDHPDWRVMAEEMLSSVHDLALAHPLAFSAWLQAADLAVGPVDQVAVLWPAEGFFSFDMARILWAQYRPRLVSAFSLYPLGKTAPGLLSNRAPINGKTTAYVCRGFTCLQPTTDIEEFSRQL